jgi:protein-L-isoaspartate O-methyltransferase
MLNKLKSIRPFSHRTSISNDLLVSASMSYTGKDPAPQSHEAHLAALKKLNLFEDLRIEKALATFDKADFCKRINPHVKFGFNPYSLDPQNIGSHQVLTSSVMHAITLKHLLYEIEATKDRAPFTMLDVGCGFGYSTLLYA